LEFKISKEKMKMRKDIIIIMAGCFLIGILAGWLITRNSEYHPEGEHTHVAEDGTVYTCSMHPQIRQNEPGQCPLCGMALTPVRQSSGESNPFVLEMTPEAMALSNVQTTEVSSGLMGQNVQLTGKIQIDEQRVQRITANFAGRLDQLLVNFIGQEVRKGQKLASIYAPELVTAQRELLETARLKDRQPALYQASLEKLRLLKISTEQIKAIESSGEIQTHVDIFADVSGVVTARNVAEGDFVNRGSVLMEVIDLRQVWVMMDVYESDLARINRGDEVSFEASAYPGKTFKAKVTYIDPLLNPGTRTVGVRAEAANPGFQLKPEMFVSARITSGQSNQINNLMIPKGAVLWTGPRAIVYVQKGNNSAPAFEMREVTLGNRSGDNYVVLVGLEEGEKVVSNGVFAVDAAAQLSGNYSMMMQPVMKTLDVPEAFRLQLESVIHQYLPVKDALVQTNSIATREAVPALLSAMSKVESGSLSKKASDVWSAIKPKLQKSINDLAKESDVELQRKHFEDLSDQLIEAVEYFGLNSETFYKQYCPMAFNDTGAYWLSSQQEIKNPYFGDKMLTCGVVKDTYQPGKKSIQDPAGSTLGGHQH
jgi:membrane fusion protein, copper/silver efflux system